MEGRDGTNAGGLGMRRGMKLVLGAWWADWAKGGDYEGGLGSGNGLGEVKDGESEFKGGVARFHLNTTEFRVH